MMYDKSVLVSAVAAGDSASRRPTAATRRTTTEDLFHVFWHNGRLAASDWDDSLCLSGSVCRRHFTVLGSPAAQTASGSLLSFSCGLVETSLFVLVFFVSVKFIHLLLAHPFKLFLHIELRHRRTLWPNLTISHLRQLHRSIIRRSNLGIWIDNGLTMSTHITKVVAGCFASLRQLHTVRRSL